MDNPWFVFHFGVTCAMIGIIWLVQVVSYPLMERVGQEDWNVYHAAHMRRIGPVVGPLMLAELLSAGVLFIGGLRESAFLFSLLPLAVCWLSTALLQVPRHRELAEKWDPVAVRRLVLGNWIRTVAWTCRGMLLWVAAGSA